MWKGGKLKLEKAKEDYLSRLKREWTEDAELAEQLASRKVDADEKKDALPKSKEDEDFEKTQLRIFFPKLRKVDLTYTHFFVPCSILFVLFVCYN